MSDIPPLEGFEEFSEFPSNSDVSELKCEICDKDDFKTLGGLRRHKTRIHGLKTEKADTAPKGSGGSRKTNLEKELLDFFAMIGMVVAMLPHPEGVYAVDGQIIIQNAERNAHAWANLCRQNKQIERIVSNLMKSTAIGEVVTAAVFTAMPMLANHGKLPPQLSAMFLGPDNAQ